MLPITQLMRPEKLLEDRNRLPYFHPDARKTGVIVFSRQAAKLAKDSTNFILDHYPELPLRSLRLCERIIPCYSKAADKKNH